MTCEFEMQRSGFGFGVRVYSRTVKPSPMSIPTGQQQAQESSPSKRV